MVDLIAEINLVVELQSTPLQQALPSPPVQQALTNGPLVLSINDHSLPPLPQASTASAQTVALASTASAQTVALASTASAQTVALASAASAQPAEPTYEEKLETHRVALQAQLDARILTGTSSFDTCDTWVFAHPEHEPATFYHHAFQKKNKRDTVEWFTDELGSAAKFVPFATKCVELFGNRLMTEVKVMNLYRQYAKIEQTAEQGPYATVGLARNLAYTNRSKVPPAELEQFQKLFNEYAPRRCREYNCELPHDAPPGQLLCQAHAGAGVITTCGTVLERDAAHNVVHRCEGEVEKRAGCFVCTECDLGLDIAETCETALTRPITSGFDKSLLRNAESLRSANNYLQGFGSTKDPNHQPSWPTRKRL